MELGTSFIRSKIGKRFFLLFLFCALLPTVVLLLLSYQRVIAQLEEQSFLRLQKETKSYGISLFERLVRMEELLKLSGTKLSLLGAQQLAADTDMQEKMSSLFTSVYFISSDGSHHPLLGSLDTQQLIDVTGYYKHGNKKSLIVVNHLAGSLCPVYMVVPSGESYLDGGLLLAELQPLFLWGIGAESLLPTMTELAVYEDSGKQVIATHISPGKDHRLAAGSLSASDMRKFEYESGGTVYLASAWGLFLQSRFETPLWTIVLSESKKDVLAPLEEFKLIFPLVILLSLWVVLLLSMYFLRKTLAPLNELKEGTRRIAIKDFTTQVDVHSGDEFEELADSFNSMTSQLRKQFNALAVIDKIDRAILSSLDTEEVVSTALQMMSEFFHTELIIFVRNDSENPETLELSVLEKGGATTPDREYTDISPAEREKLFTNQEYTLFESSESIPRFLSPFVASDRLFLSLPLLADKKLAGAVVMSLSALDPEHVSEEIKQARQIADQLAIALANATLVQDLERLSLGTVEALARTVDAKSDWTAGHSERVAEIAVKIGRAMGLDAQDIELLNRGGLLHDIGKIGVPLAILDKPGRLDDEELHTVRCHPLIGEKILEPIEVYKDIMPIIVQHHERFDGKGYPHGLSGDDIDLNARVLAVADGYDALISQRPYREGWALEKVLSFLEEQKGKMFDPAVVDVFMTIVPDRPNV